MNGGVYAYRREIGADLAGKQASKQRKAKLNKAEQIKLNILRQP